MRLALLLATFATLASWGCDSDDESSDTAANAINGATFGADIHVAVSGRGRVTAKAAGIDCPSACFGEVASAADAKGGVALVAQPSAGSVFVGWSFENVILGTRGSGPDTCSPMKSESVAPSVSLIEPSLTIPFGGVKAWPPAGREAECADFTTVPIGYSVIAKFAEIADANDGVDEILTTPAPGVEARELGIIGPRLYWRFQPSGDSRSGIASGLASGGNAAIVVPATDPITAFDVDTHVLYQRAGVQSTQWRIPGGSVMPEQLNGLTGYSCDAFASEVPKAYCLIMFSGSTTSSIYSWNTGVGAQLTFLYQLPWRSRSIAVDIDSLFYSEDDQGGAEAASIIRNGPKLSPGGQVTPFPRVIGLTAPRDLRVGEKYLYFIDDGTSASTTSVKIGSRSATSAPELVTVPGGRLIAPDPDEVEGVLWVGAVTATGYAIIKAQANPASTMTFRANLPALGGLAVDTTYVYWTQGDAKVYRAKKKTGF